MNAESLVLVERDGHRGELVLNRPSRRNALIGPLVEALRAGLAELVADEEVHVILIRGAGARAVKSAPEADVLAVAGAYADLLATTKPAGMAGVKNNIRLLSGVADFRELIASVQAARMGTGAGPGTGLRGR